MPDGALFTELDAALSTADPDLVVLATPPMGHLEQAKQVFDQDELTQLGESMKARKEDLMRQQAATK